MKQFVIELDDETAEKLDRFVPEHSRERSQFACSAIRRALWELEERATSRAYRKRPDSGEDAHMDVRAWESEKPHSSN